MTTDAETSPPQKSRKAKTQYGSIATQDPEASAGTSTPDLTIPIWESGTLRLQQLVTRIEGDFFEFCVWAQRAIAEQWHTKYGYVDAGPYFQDKINISYRTVRRRLSILEALQKLPPSEQEAAKNVLASIGVKKAAAISPLIGVIPEWKELAQFAHNASEEAVQQAVSERLEHKGRGRSSGGSQPGDRFLAFLLNNVPPDERDFVAQVFRKGGAALESKNAVAVFLTMVMVFAQELMHQGIDIEVPVAPPSPPSQ